MMAGLMLRVRFGCVVVAVVHRRQSAECRMTCLWSMWFLLSACRCRTVDLNVCVWSRFGIDYQPMLRLALGLSGIKLS